MEVLSKNGVEVEASKQKATEAKPEVNVWKTLLLGISLQEDKVVMKVARYYTNGAIDKDSDLAPIPMEEFLTLYDKLKEDFHTRVQKTSEELDRLQKEFEEGKMEVGRQEKILDDFVTSLKQ